MGAADHLVDVVIFVFGAHVDLARRQYTQIALSIVALICS